MTKLLHSLNNNYGNFYQTKYQCLHNTMHFQNVATYFIFFNKIFKLRMAKLEIIRKKIIVFQDYPLKTHNI